MTPSDTDIPESGQAELILSALLAGRSYATAAEAAGVSKSTVQRRMGEPAFRGRLASERAMLAQSVRDRLIATSVQAVDTLRQLMTDDSVADSTRVRAAVAVVGVIDRGRHGLSLADAPAPGEPCGLCGHREPTDAEREADLERFKAQLQETERRLSVARERKPRDEVEA